MIDCNQKDRDSRPVNSNKLFAYLPDEVIVDDDKYKLGQVRHEIDHGTRVETEQLHYVHGRRDVGWVQDVSQAILALELPR